MPSQTTNSHISSPGVLAVAGSDSSSGAGIQADLATCAALDVECLCAITAVTAQTADSVSAIEPVSPEMVAAQIAAALSEGNVSVVKTGMLPNARIVDAVVDSLAESGLPIVVDPVLAASAGRALADDSAFDAMLERLFPVAAWITPNIPEAERILDAEIADIDAMRSAAAEIAAKWDVACVVKGGHADFIKDGVVMDVLALRNGGIVEMKSPRVEISAKSARGTGCRFCSAIAAEIAKGAAPADAAAAAQGFVAKYLCKT